MRPSLKVTLGQWLSRGKGLIFPKFPQKELFALKVWKKGEKIKMYMLPPVRFELTTPGLQDQCSATEL